VNSKPNGLLVLAALGAAAVAYVVLVFVPGHKAIAQMREQIETKRRQVVLSGTSGAAIETTRKDLARAKACIAAWDAKSPSVTDLAALFGRINALVKSSGAINTRFEPEPVRRRERLIEIPLSIGLLGSYPQIDQFLCSLEGLPATLWVDSAKIVAMKNGATVHGEIRLVVFTVNSDNSDYVKVAGKPIN
jgi:Tfp pilus assembly protein PilO